MRLLFNVYDVIMMRALVNANPRICFEGKQLYMDIRFNILRTDRSEHTQYMQRIIYTTEDENDTVAAALTRMNEAEGLKDVDGKEVKPIAWECSCLQKKCGACAMVINDRPALACSVRLSELKKPEVTLKPLSKFPVVEDLMVDRSILYENLNEMGTWLEGEAIREPVDYDMAYEGSRCLQCGCCLEVCPNFYPGGVFFGMAAFTPTVRLIAEMEEEQRKEVYAEYKKHIYNGCGKSLACRDICPAGIDIDGLLVNSNAMAIWKRRGVKKGKGR